MGRVMDRNGFWDDTSFRTRRVSYRFDANRFDGNRFGQYRFESNRFDLYRFDKYRFDAIRFDLTKLPPKLKIAYSLSYFSCTYSLLI
ncbi:hypothetical protein Hanom_Chr06g00531311 [Helianthus anomalus]